MFLCSKQATEDELTAMAKATLPWGLTVCAKQLDMSDDGCQRLLCDCLIVGGRKPPHERCGGIC